MLIDEYMGTTGAQAGLLFVSVLWFCLAFMASLRPCSLFLLCFMCCSPFAFAFIWHSLWLLIALSCLFVVSSYAYTDENILFYICVSIYVFCSLFCALLLAKKCRFVLPCNDGIKWKIIDVYI